MKLFVDVFDLKVRPPEKSHWKTPLEHDAAMAHALTQALQQHRQSPSTLNGQTVTYTEEYVIDGVLATADRLMAAWGYTEQRAIDEALPDPWRVDDGGR